MVRYSFALFQRLNQIMLNCEFCHTNPISSSLTRCCKSLICSSCKQKLDKKLVCPCGSPFSAGKKSCNDCPQILDLLTKFNNNKIKQCDRCESQADFECTQCEMVFCASCNNEVHAAIGFAKHERKKYVATKHDIEKLRKKQILCRQHSQTIVMGCECGSAICTICLKTHKETCSKGVKTKPLREFKQQYYINVLFKIRQLAQYKSKLCGDKDRYLLHFKNQETAFQNNQKLVEEQFEYLIKMIQLKYSETKTRLKQYWQNCSNVFRQNINKINAQINLFNDYGEIIQKFAQNLMNLEYFQRKVKRFNFNFDYINARVANMDQVQSSIMGITIVEKPWEVSNASTNLCQNIESRQSLKEQARLFGNIQNTSELMFDYTNNPLKDRQLHLLPSHCEIYYSFIHLPYQNLKYQLQYGVGMKIKGQEIFKQVANTNGYGAVEGLNSNTKYRVRMRVVEGTWGPISEITTLDIPKFNLESYIFAKSIGENSIQLVKGGAVYGSNEINFGVHRWVIKLTSKSISYEQSQTACLSVGVSNKQTKKATFVGSTLNYGYQKSEIILKILLDCNEKRMVISSSINNQEQVYQNLPNFPLFPTIQNKGNGQVFVRYNLTTDDSNLC